MTVADIDKDVVSGELKAQLGEDAESALYLDMNLYQIVSKGGENGNWESQLTDLDDTITVTLNVPAPAEGSYYIIREHGDGEDRTYSRIAAEFIPDEDDPTVGTVTFETDKFSTYAIAEAPGKGDNEDNDVTPPSYQFLEGANGSWTQGSEKTLAFRADGELSKFIGVKVDGTLIDAKNYTAVSGSTIVTLKADYLKTLTVGTHRLTVLYSDGECTTNFKVNANQKPTGTTTTAGVQTGDDSHLWLWFALMFVSGAGVLGTTVSSKRTKHAK